MSSVICISNPFKANVGRTSLAVNFAATLSVLEKNVLLIDCNSNAVATSMVYPKTQDMDYALEDLMTGLVSSRAVISGTELTYLNIIPAGNGLRDIETDLKYNPEKEKVLDIVTRTFRDTYDYIILDTPADTGLMSRSAIIASDSLMIPVLCNSEASENFAEILRYASTIRRASKTPIKISGVVFNRCAESSDLDALVCGDDFDDIKTVMYPVMIPENGRFVESTDTRLPACLIDIKSNYAEAFLDLSFEFLYREKTVC